METVSGFNIVFCVRLPKSTGLLFSSQLFCAVICSFPRRYEQYRFLMLGAPAVDRIFTG